jgi:hypothetical protein
MKKIWCLMLACAFVWTGCSKKDKVEAPAAPARTAVSVAETEASPVPPLREAAAETEAPPARLPPGTVTLEMQDQLLRFEVRFGRAPTNLAELARLSAPQATARR